MKSLMPFMVGAVCVASLYSCNKQDYVGTPDKTVNITAPRQWMGTHYGYGKDSLSDGTILATWFSKNISDTAIVIQKYDVLTIKAFGLMLRYKGTDDVAGTMRFDTTLPSSAPTVLIYNSTTNKMTFEYHKLSDWNATSGHNYEEHFTLQTK